MSDYSDLDMSTTRMSTASDSETDELAQVRFSRPMPAYHRR